MANEVNRRYFDLNIEKVLEAWSISHAIRELIANALDERALTGTAEVDISRVGPDIWSIRDYGRGLQHCHLTQNDNPEKHEREKDVLGRFGVGLKDALAVLDRRSIGICIRSRHGDISLVHRPKAGFEDIATLHACVEPASNAGMVGTEVLLTGIAEQDLEIAREYFLVFSDDTVLETTRFGQILQRRPDRSARIYVKGLVVAEEPEFAFSYNVTSLTAPMRRALNRERTNVARTAYNERVKAMLLAAESPGVARVLVDDLRNLAAGRSREEVRAWTDVGVRACQVVNAARPVVFVTAEQLVVDKEMVDRAVADGREVITIPSTVAMKLSAVTDVVGKPLQSLERFANDWAASVELRFVDERDLAAEERAVFSRWREIAALDGGVPPNVTAVRVSETMRPSIAEGMHPAGLWDPISGEVVVHRSQLRNVADFAGTLLHELTHARTGYTDVSRDFEGALTVTIGSLASDALRSKR